MFLQKCRTLHFSTWNFMRFLSACIPSLLMSLWVATQPPGVSATPPSLLSSASSLKVADNLQLPDFQGRNRMPSLLFPSGDHTRPALLLSAISPSTNQHAKLCCCCMFVCRSPRDQNICQGAARPGWLHSKEAVRYGGKYRHGCDKAPI